MKNEKLGIEYKLIEGVNKIKAQTTVSVLDIEEFLDLLIYIQRDIERLRNSRFKWREECIKLRAEKCSKAKEVGK